MRGGENVAKLTEEQQNLKDLLWRLSETIQADSARAINESISAWQDAVELANPMKRLYQLRNITRCMFDTVNRAIDCAEMNGMDSEE